MGDDPIHARLAFLADFTVYGLAEAMKAACHKAGINAETYTAPYGQYVQEILNPSSGLYAFQPDLVFILLDTEHALGDTYYFPYRLSRQQREELAQEKASELKNLVAALEEQSGAKIVMNTLLTPHHSSLGILESKQEFGLRKAVQAINDALERFSMGDSRLFLFDFNVFASEIGRERLSDRKMHYFADMRLSPRALADLSREYMAYLLPLAHITKKCIVLDLDNTLWGGILGEEGPASIRLGPEKEGKPYMDLQKRLLALQERGVLLAINSSNNPTDVTQVMANNKYMLLKENRFACMKVNWQDKAANLREIARELNIGLDSLVFLDDELANREMIKAVLPEVTVLDFPEDPALLPAVIEDTKLFSTFSVTQEDLKRGEAYAAEKGREKLKSAVNNVEDFIRQLNLQVKVADADKDTIPRIAQLTQKTNQFNLTTRRYFDEDIRRFSRSDLHLVKYADVQDRFGEYGITGVAIVKKLKGDEWEIDSFLLSCRILGKRVEFTFMQRILEEAAKAGVSKLCAAFMPTGKNAPAANFLKDFGFSLLRQEEGQSLWEMKVREEKSEKPEHIQVRGN